jgi:hypothetical protein
MSLGSEKLAPAAANDIFSVTDGASGKLVLALFKCDAAISVSPNRPAPSNKEGGGGGLPVLPALHRSRRSTYMLASRWLADVAAVKMTGSPWLLLSDVLAQVTQTPQAALIIT